MRPRLVGAFLRRLLQLGDALKQGFFDKVVIGIVRLRDPLRQDAQADAAMQPLGELVALEPRDLHQAGLGVHQMLIDRLALFLGVGDVALQVLLGFPRFFQAHQQFGEVNANGRVIRVGLDIALKQGQRRRLVAGVQALGCLFQETA